MRMAAIVLGGLLLGAACGKDNGLQPAVPASATCMSTIVTATEGGSVDSISENVDLTCESVASTLAWKNAATGASCATPLDCTPYCVVCANGTHHTLASWCDHGRCASPDAVACMVLGTPGLTSCSK